MLIKSVRDLDVYQESLRLLPKLYKLLSKMPDLEKDTIWQTKRAAKSIPAIIAEGFAKRGSTKEFKRYLLIALGSSDEVITHLEVIKIIVPDLSEESQQLISDYTIISKRINSLHKKWNINKIYLL